ncbi:MAG: hypothetical protein GF332_03260 [Candidatus Moranbacteria bacterium]|nr:hypothetical protein [Candidatus Moranbacteria bacterium]
MQDFNSPDQSNWNCENCGQDNHSLDNFCKNCGQPKQPINSQSNQSVNLNTEPDDYYFPEQSADQSQPEPPNYSENPQAQPVQVNNNSDIHNRLSTNQSANSRVDYSGNVQNLADSAPKKKSGFIKSFFKVFFALLLLVIIGFGGYWLYNNQNLIPSLDKNNQEQRQNIQKASKDFIAIVKKVNQLYDEGLNQHDDADSLDVMLKSLEETQTQTQALLKDIDQARKDLEKLSDSNQLAFYGLVKDFYQNIQQTLKTREDYLAYMIEVKRIRKKSNEQNEKIDNSFRVVRSESEQQKLYESSDMILGEEIKAMQDLTPPPDLEDYHKKEIQYLEKTRSLSNAIHETDGNQARLDAYLEFLDFTCSSESFKEGRELMEFYQDTLQKEIDSAREKADKAKNELIKQSVKMNFDVEEFYIQSW